MNPPGWARQMVSGGAHKAIPLGYPYPWRHFPPFGRLPMKRQNLSTAFCAWGGCFFVPLAPPLRSIPRAPVVHGGLWGPNWSSRYTAAHPRISGGRRAKTHIFSHVPHKTPPGLGPPNSPAKLNSCTKRSVVRDAELKLCPFEARRCSSHI